MSILTESSGINCLICGMVGSGKSTVMMDLLTTVSSEQYLTYTRIIIFAQSHSFNSSCYAELKLFLGNVNDSLRKLELLKENETIYQFIPVDEYGIKDIKDISYSQGRTIVIFDDVLCCSNEDKNKIDK
jgi:GTPase SAR1 family protein